MTPSRDADAFANARTLLFVPGDRPDRFDKAANSGADGIILDLEDAVADGKKESARSNVTRWLNAGGVAAVRVNGADTPWLIDDLAAISKAADTIMLPKASVRSVTEVVARIGARCRVLALIETAAGIVDASSICASPCVVRAAFGSIDLGAEIGVDPGDREALLHARSSVVLASAAAGIAPPLDGVTTDVSSGQPSRIDAEYAARLGFSGKLCIHPKQIPEANAAFDPSGEQISWARAVVRAAGDGVAKVDGHMVDEPVVRRASRLLARLGQQPEH